MFRLHRVPFLCAQAFPKGVRTVVTAPRKEGVVATVFGCTGFTGRYVVETLANAGLTVIIPFRGDEKSFRHLKVIGQVGQVVPTRIDVRNPATLERAIFHSNIVINMMSRFWETRNFTFDDINVKAATLIAELSKGVDRFVHISAAGVSKDSPSEWARTKAIGEENVKKILPWATILKPTVMFGDEDRVLNRFGRLSVMLPVIPTVESAEKKLIQPVSAVDFSDAILAALTRQSAIGQTYVLGGPEVLTWKQVADKSFEATRRRDKRMVVPPKIARLAAHALEYGWMLGNEPILTRDEMDHYDNTDVVVRHNDKTFSDLGITHKLENIDLSIARVSRVYRDPAHQSDLVDQSPHSYKDHA